MSSRKICYILIDSTAQVIKAERVLKAQALAFELVPKPRQLTSDCGMCIACSPNELEAVTEVLASANIQLGGIHYLETPTSSFLAKLFGG